MRAKSDIFPVLIGLLLIVLSSCTGKEAYPGFHHIQDGRWYRDSLLRFTVDSLPPSSGTRYEVTIELTVNRSYPYRDIWLLVDQNVTDSLMRTDTLRYFLADEYGKWLGGSVGGLTQFSLPYCSFNLRDSVCHYRLSVRHAMDDEILRGVEKVGIKLNRVNGNKQ